MIARDEERGHVERAGPLDSRGGPAEVAREHNDVGLRPGLRERMQRQVQVREQRDLHVSSPFYGRSVFCAHAARPRRPLADPRRRIVFHGSRCVEGVDAFMIDSS